jgi:Fur family ferric uptake transcriptional regulator
METDRDKNKRLPRPDQNSLQKNSNPNIIKGAELEPVDEKTFKRMIREMHLKVTSQRMFILETMYALREHVTAQEVFEVVNKQHPEIGFATVYRFLKKMTEFKFVTEVRMGGAPARYELTPASHHDHLSCTVCGCICEFENPAIEKLQGEVAEKFGFKLTNHVLELYGICPDCQTR